jgi:hypothetical protein
MHTDSYTKAVLTIIAAALVAIALQGNIRPASAQMDSECGRSERAPCYVQVDGGKLPFVVTVEGTVDVRGR